MLGITLLSLLLFAAADSVPASTVDSSDGVVHGSCDRAIEYSATDTEAERMPILFDIIIPILSAGIVAIGWFVTGYQNRLQIIVLKRLEYRLDALEAFLPVKSIIEKNSDPFTQQGFLEKLEDARSKFQLYGYEDEIELMEKFIKAIEQKNLNDANSAYMKLVPLVRTHIRQELKIES